MCALRLADPLRFVSPSPIPYRYKLTTPLLRVGTFDRWLLKDACEGTCILGGMGSGKSSGSGKAILRAFLRAGFGGLVLCAKSNEARNIYKEAKACGRGNSVIIFDASGKHRFNFLDYTAATLARDGFEQNLAVALQEAAIALNTLKNTAGTGGGGNEFFYSYSSLMLTNALPLLKKAMGRLRLKELQRFIDSAPRAIEEARSETWQKESFCSEVLMKCAHMADQGDKQAERYFEEHADFWLDQFASVGDRTRGSVVATLSTTINGLMTGKIADLFSTDTTLVPELTQEGAIIVLDMSAHEFGEVGIVAQQIFKVLWMKSIQQRPMSPTMRPNFLWADEAQTFFSEADAAFLAVCREYRACPVYLTQDVPTFRAALGGDNAENRGNQVLAKFQTRIFHANTDPVTNSFASETIGQVRRYRVNWSQSGSLNSGVSGNAGERETGSGGGDGKSRSWSRSIDSYEDADVPPEYFGNELRNGGKPNRYQVDAIMVRSAARFFATRRNRIKLTFDQRAKA